MENNLQKRYVLRAIFALLIVVCITSIASNVSAAQETMVFDNSDVTPTVSPGKVAGYCANDATATAYCKSKGYEGFTSYTPRWLGPTLYNDLVYKWNGSSFQLVSGNVCAYHIIPITCYRPIPVAPSVDMKANGQNGTITINQGEYVTISWTSTGVGYCNTGVSYSPWGPYIEKPTSGSEVVRLMSSFTYGIQCSVDNGSRMLVMDTVGVSVRNPCTSHATKSCSGNSVYWYDSCGHQEEIYQTCTGSQVCNNAQCQNVVCDSGSDCGTNGYIGSVFCQNGDVYQNYRTYTCNNAGTANATCTSSTTAQLKINCSGSQTCENGSCTDQNIECDSNSDCGSNGYTSSPFCQNSDVYQNYRTYVCHNSGTVSSYCSNSTSSQLKTNCMGDQACNNGACEDQDIECDSNSDCGVNGYTGSAFCQGNNVYQNYRTYTCHNAGSASSYCSSSTSDKLKTTCSGNQTCNNGSCGNNCTGNSYKQCSGNSIYWYDSCGNRQNFVESCSNGCTNGSCSNNNNCTYHSFRQCVGNSVYWYDSCGSQQDLIQYCSNGCTNGYCSNNNNNNCTYHAYKLCSGNSVYWYDSCGTMQDLVQNCSSGLTCQYGQCTTYSQPTNYISHYRLACYGKSIYWYDSLGSATGLYKACGDSNTCTLDSCSSSKCSYSLKCDGTTCKTSSVDYQKYCADSTDHCGNGTCETNLEENSTNCLADCKPTPTDTNTLSVSFLGKKEVTAVQWEKTIQVNQNGTVYFIISVVNNSNNQIDDVNVSANIPSEVSFIGNAKINDVPASGDVVSGINLGSIANGSSKVLTFEGKVQNFTAESSKQATATVSVSGVTQSDNFTINFVPGQAAAVSQASGGSWFVEFLKKWYLWILVAIVLVFLFFVVFRRLSSAE